MFRNYILIAIRNISHNLVFSSINILGLTIGIACSLLLYLYIDYELSFDAFHANKSRIFRVITNAQIQDTRLHTAASMSPMGSALKNDYSEVEDFVRIRGGGETLVIVEENQFIEERIYITDSSFFSIFSFELITGDASTCLTEPNSIVLTKSLADKYFPDASALGKVIKTGGDQTDRTITGIMADPPPNSHLQPAALIAYSSFPANNFWGIINDYTYILLHDGADYKNFNKHFADVYDKYVSEFFSQIGATADFSLQPLTDIYLRSDLDNEIEPVGNMAYLYLFGAIGLFTLLVACINYMNLATARSGSRAKEVGIRKAMGSYKSQLIGQFITESMVIALFALILGMVAVFFLIPYFNGLAGAHISHQFLNHPRVVGILLAIVLFVGLVGGSYPSFYLSHFKPAEVLKGKPGKKAGNELLRKVLVISQFSISLFMIISTWVVFDQLQYLKNKDLGFNKDQVIKIMLNGSEARNKLDVLRHAFLQNPNIESVGSGFGSPGSENLNISAISVESYDGTMIEKIFQTIYVDNQYLPTLEIPIVLGRNFLPHVGNDTADAVIVNEELVKRMGWDEPIGKKFKVFISQELETRKAKVIGVCKNFHMRALQEPIEPLVMHNNLNNGQVLVRLSGNDISASIDHLKTAFDKVIHNRPFAYNFLDQDFQEKYVSDEKRGEIFAIFSLLTIFIACLGLYGLASFTAELRRKEIGVRKVVGASIGSIIYMMSRDFLKLVMLSMLVAFPVSYYFMSRWLEQFAFRIDIQISSFVLSAALTLLVAFGTVLYHSLKYAVANPSASLREN